MGTRAKATRVHPMGFSLIELMITVAVLAVLVTIAAPSFLSVINSSRLTSHANELVASLQQARMEAIRRNAGIKVCRTSDGAACNDAAGAWTGWLTVVESTGEILRANTVKAPVRVTSSQANSITFSADGLAHAAGGLLQNQFTVCLPTTHPAENQRAVSVVGGSRISTASRNGNGACP